MKYNFDEPVVRRGTSCVKHDMLKEVFGTEDLLPMWVADMDFKTPDFIVNAVRERCNHEVFGYTFAPNTYICAVLNWFQSHYGIESKWNKMHFIPGIVQGIAFVLQAFTQPGDNVLLTTPVYPPFLNVPHRSGRRFVNSSLKTVNGRFEIDYEDFEEKAKGCKVFILANPHNPGGTVWTAEELRRIAEICYRQKVLVISDEIHADLTLPGHHHISFSKVSDEAYHNSITFFAPSKTFNMAGLASSVGYVPDPDVRRQFFNFLDANELSLGNLFAYVGAEAAFRYGEEWRLQMLDYIQANADFAIDYLAKNAPKVVAMRPEASFLLWLDFNAYGLPHDELVRIMIEEAKVGLNSGTDYGRDGSGFMRLNFGCSRATLEEGLRRICDVLRNR
ncbi:MAG: pyridoxal phosphate-dependent aminotransferase [Bacteroidales bacterium]|nr:pyridoxal phosphate-dependent aminotransferase [Bacteroidales bacterium]